MIISGFTLKNYLSARTLIAKVIGLVFTLGGGLPVGKEVSVVHDTVFILSSDTRSSESQVT